MLVDGIAIISVVMEYANMERSGVKPHAAHPFETAAARF